MIRKIIITPVHYQAATEGLRTNLVARAINDHIRSDYRARVGLSSGSRTPADRRTDSNPARDNRNQSYNANGANAATDRQSFYEPKPRSRISGMN